MPPRHPLVRGYRVFAPETLWRRALVPVAAPARRGRATTRAVTPRAVTVPPAQRDPEGGERATMPSEVPVGSPLHPMARIDWATRRVWDVAALK